jgi:hypothetical protein
MEIKITDDAGIRTQFDREFGTVNEPNPFNLLSKYIKSNFRDCLTLVSSLMDSGNPSFHIQLEPNKKVYGHMQVMASVDMEKSKHGCYYFNLYYSTLQELLTAILDPETEQSRLVFSRFFNTVLHELIHCADILSVKEYVQIALAGTPVKRNSAHNLIPLAEENGISLNWALVYFLGAYRNEGVAIMGEKLFGIKMQFEHEFPAEERHNLFYRCFYSIIDQSKGLKFYNRLQIEEVLAKVGEFSGYAYQYGDLFLLDLLRLRHPDLEELIDRATSEVHHQHAVCCTAEEKISLMKLVFEIDISEFMQAVLQNIRKHPDAGEPMVEAILQCSAIWQDDSNPVAISSFAKSVAHAAHRKDEAGFLDAMKQSVGSVMQEEEILSGLSRYLQMEHTEDIVHELKIQAKRLFDRYQQDQNPVAAHALTYLLDDEDLMFDQIPLLGWQDDWMVLEAALILLNQRPQQNQKSQ